MMVKGLLIQVAVLALSLNAFANQETTESSEIYVQSVLDLLDETKSKKAEITSLKKEVSQATKTAAASSKSVRDAESSISKKQARLVSLPGKISRNESLISQKRKTSRNILSAHFPGATNADEAISQTQARQSSLISEKGRLQSSLRVIESDYNSKINRLESSINTNSQKIEELRGKRQANRRRIDQIQPEVREIQGKIDEVKRIKNAPGFPARLQNAREAYRVADAKRSAEGRNCKKKRFISGRYKDRSQTCKAFRSAKATRNRLNAINSGDRIKSLRQSIRAKKDELEDLKSKQPRLRARIENLTEEVRSDNRSLERTKDDKRIATRPTRQAIAQVDFDLDNLQGKLSFVEQLQTLRSEISGHRSNIARYEREEISLPGDITNLQNSLSGLRSQAQADTESLTVITQEKDSVIKSMQDKTALVESNRLTLQTTAGQTSPVLFPVDPETPQEVQEVLYESRDWSVLVTDFDNNFARASCKAQTSLTTTIEELEVSATLDVINVENTEGTYNQPLVTLTVASNTGVDLNNYKSATLRASSTKEELSMDLIYSMSDEGKLVYMSKLSDRKKLISLIAAKNTMRANLKTSEPDVSESLSFSLRGSSNALKSSSKDSLKKACGGIEVTSF